MKVRKYLFQDPNRDNQLSLQTREFFFQDLAYVYPSLKFNIFFDLGIYYMNVTQIIVQSLKITMEHFLSKMEL
jgi:hypothetical protein